MTLRESEQLQRVPLSRSQQNIYNGVVQDGDPDLYLIGRRYRFRPLPQSLVLAALHATIQSNPVHVCILEASATGESYPELVPRLQPTDIVELTSDEEAPADHGARALTSAWHRGILSQPLVRYTVRTDRGGRVHGLDVHCHHILLDGGGTGIVERDLGNHLAAGGSANETGAEVGLARLAMAHRREADRIADSAERLTQSLRRELIEESREQEHGPGGDDSPGSAAKGLLCEAVALSGPAYDNIVALAEAEHVPLNVLVAAAAVAVDASIRKRTESLLVHAVDNRFGDPELDVATCLVNSVAHTVRFPAFASVADVVRSLDRGYVKAIRRRWLREERYRRMYMAINRTTHVEALALNFLPEPCAPQLRSFLSEAPVTTDIGPIETMTVASVLDEEAHTLQIAVWTRADLAHHRNAVGVAGRIAAALQAFTAMWDQPIAMTVDDWLSVTHDGACEPADRVADPQPGPTRAWFVNETGGVVAGLNKRRHVEAWIAWLVGTGVEPGDVIVCTDDDTDKTIDLLLACHLCGCAYSVCDSPDQVASRASMITAESGASTCVVEPATVTLPPEVDNDLRLRIDRHVEQVVHDPELAAATAYLMPTSGSTGEPKLVRIVHGALALFCHAVSRAYGWGPRDTVLQCAPLTSDISVEEIFAGVFSGCALVRSAAMKTGDLHALTRDLPDTQPTVLDLPTAVWHLLCEDDLALQAISRSTVRQMVVGGEAIRSDAVDKWTGAGVSQRIEVLSSYGPTETTVVVSYVPIISDGIVAEPAARPRLGRPVVPGTVALSFGEVVVVGELVSPGYLGVASESFGVVTTTAGEQCRVFATADRVSVDKAGFPVFSGRRDALVKVGGKRIDTADVARQIVGDPEICDVAVELRAGRLGVWFESRTTRAGGADSAVAARIRSLLLGRAVPSFVVAGVPRIPRKANGKIDSDKLLIASGSADVESGRAGSGGRAARIAQIWSAKLHRTIGIDTSLLDEGIGSLDLISILPETRRYLGWQVSIFDLISADTAANLAEVLPLDHARAEALRSTEIERDLELLWRPQSTVNLVQPMDDRDGDGPIVVLGASGILGTGFADAVLQLRQSGKRCPEVVLAMRSQPAGHPWDSLRTLDGVRIERLPTDFGSADLDDLLRSVAAGTLVNCIGSANMLAPYPQLRAANVEVVTSSIEACLRNGTRLVHLSSSVVTEDALAPHVTDPRWAPYPYAGSKALAELAVTCAPEALDFTMVRLPRILGAADQLQDATDTLVSVVDACVALQAFPRLTVTEEATTGAAAAKAILGRLPGVGVSTELGRGIIALRGEVVNYAEFLAEFVDQELDAAEWKCRLDESDWARSNPRRWAIVDGWMTLGMKLGGRSYAQYLSGLPAIDLSVGSVEALAALPDPLRSLLQQGYSQSR